MSSEKQIEANRLNAQKSTGPRTEAGKAASRMNALKSGIHAQSEIVRSEVRADFETLTAEYLARFNPATPEERLCVDTLVRADWNLRRFARIDAQLLDHEMDYAYKLDTANPLGHAYSRAYMILARLQHRINSTHREYRTALHELERLQSLSTENGFVPQPACGVGLSLPTREAAADKVSAAPTTENGFVPLEQPSHSASNPPIGLVPQPAASSPGPRFGFVPQSAAFGPSLRLPESPDSNPTGCFAVIRNSEPAAI
jgi:hypothetical protein